MEHNDNTISTIYFDNDSKKILWLFIDKNSPDFNAHVDTLTDVALAFRGQVRCIVAIVISPYRNIQYNTDFVHLSKR